MILGIDKLNQSPVENRDMSQYISTRRTQSDAIQRIMQTTTNSIQATYNHHFQNVLDHARTMDQAYTEIKNRKQQENKAEWEKKGKEGRNENGGRGNNNNQGGRGGRTGSRGRGQGVGRDNRNGNIWAPPDLYRELTPDQRNLLQSARSRTPRENNEHGNSNYQAYDEDGNSNYQAYEAQTNNQTSGNQESPNSNTPALTHTTTTLQPGGVLRNMLANASHRSDPVSLLSEVDSFSIGGRTYRSDRQTNTLRYHITNSNSSPNYGALIDSGANGGMAGRNVRILETDRNHSVDITGIGGQALTALPIVQCAAVVNSIDEGPIIIILSRYASNPESKTIHSKGQLEYFGCIVDDTSRRMGGQQLMITPEGYTIPLHVRDGLTYMDTHPPSDEELQSYPHVFLTSDSFWDPSCLDAPFPDILDEAAHDPMVRRNQRTPLVNDFGEIVINSSNSSGTATTTSASITEFFGGTSLFGIPIHHLPTYHDPTHFSILAIERLSMYPQQLHRNYTDLDLLKPHFGWVNNDRTRKTLDATSQFYRAAATIPFASTSSLVSQLQTFDVSTNGSLQIPYSQTHQP